MVDQVMDAVKQCDAVSADLATSLGFQPRVDFDLKSNSGMTVRVTFEGIPSRPSIAEIAEKPRQAVLAEFQQPPPQRIIVGFACRRSLPQTESFDRGHPLCVSAVSREYSERRRSE